MMRPSRPLPLVLAVACAVAFGCGESSKNPLSPIVVGDGLPDSIPQSSTPDSLLHRLEAAWELEKPAAWFALLSADYRFTFSSAADPELVVRYGDGWDLAHEKRAVGHVFSGFTNEQGEYQLPIATCVLTRIGTSVVDDPDHPDSTVHYRKVVFTLLEGRLGFAGGEEFQISAPQDLHLVRGDAAVLAAGQAARSDRWYVRRWVDRSAPLFVLGPVGHAAQAITWGSLRARYG